MVTYTWIIEQLDCYPEFEGEKDVVFTVHWRYRATETTFSSEQYGSQALQPYTPGTPFTPYNELTEDQVIGWLTEALGDSYIAVMQEELAQDILRQENPTQVSPPLPWA